MRYLTIRHIDAERKVPSIHGVHTPAAGLAGGVRSKEAAGREKERLTFPTLRRLLDRIEGSEEWGRRSPTPAWPSTRRRSILTP
jgi:hypothetical protein